MYTEGKLLHTSRMLACSLILMAVVAAQGWQRPCLKPVGTGTVTPLAQQPGFLRLLHRRQVQDQGAGSPISGMGLALPLYPQDSLLQGKKCLEKIGGPA
jgi:hypothetical protein